MKILTKQFKIIGLLSLFSVTLLSPLCAQTNNTIASISLTNQIAFELSAFETNKLIGELGSAIGDIANASSSVARRQQAYLWFQVLAVIDKNIDTNFDTPNYYATNGFALNLVPPRDGTNGIRYPSGIPPSYLKDPKARAQYEAALAINREHAANYGFQSELRRVNVSADFGCKHFLTSAYTSSKDDRDEFNEVLEHSSLSYIRKQELKELFDGTH